MITHFLCAVKHFGKAVFEPSITKFNHLGRWNLQNNAKLSLYLANVDNEQSRNDTKYCKKEAGKLIETKEKTKTILEEFHTTLF